jgi:hypothetical protein
LRHFNPEFVDASKHVSDGITLLCGTHHTAASRGHVAPIEVSEADADRRVGAAFQGGAYLLRLRAPAQLAVGPMIFMGDGKLLQICGTTILRRDSDTEGRVWLSGNLFDDRGSASMVIDKNVIVLRPQNWDVRIVFRLMSCMLVVSRCSTPTGTSMRISGTSSSGGSVGGGGWRTPWQLACLRSHATCRAFRRTRGSRSWHGAG